MRHSLWPIDRVRTAVKTRKIRFFFLFTDSAQNFRIGSVFEPLQKCIVGFAVFYADTAQIPFLRYMAFSLNLTLKKYFLGQFEAPSSKYYIVIGLEGQSLRRTLSF